MHATCHTQTPTNPGICWEHTASCNDYKWDQLHLTQHFVTSPSAFSPSYNWHGSWPRQSPCPIPSQTTRVPSEPKLLSFLQLTFQCSSPRFCHLPFILSNQTALVNQVCNELNNIIHRIHYSHWCEKCIQWGVLITFSSGLNAVCHKWKAHSSPHTPKLKWIHLEVATQT